MKYLLVICVTAVALAFASGTTAQEPPPDFGETNLLKVACDNAVAFGRAQGLTIRNCRRAGPDEVNGYNAVVPIRVNTAEEGIVPLRVNLHKSLWYVGSWSAG